MTVLHFSSRWPTGLAILLSTDATSLINHTCVLPTSSIGWSALDFAIEFKCEESVRILLDSGCVWNKVSTPGSSSIACFRLVAEKLAARRRGLFELAEGVLTPQELSVVCPAMELADSMAAAIVGCLRGAGIDVPGDLDVPDDYEGIYFSGNLNFAHWPLFLEAGFHDICRRNTSGLTAVQVVGVDIYPFMDWYFRGPGRESVPTALELRKHLREVLDRTPSDPLELGTNTSATGRHLVALRLLSQCPGQTEHPLLEDLLQSPSTDLCKCPCSSMGCLPLHTYLKALLGSRYIHRRNETSALSYPADIWNYIPDEMAPELLRFITFEALEMTHTCCSCDASSHPHAVPRCENCGLGYFPGNAEEIHDEEEELIGRLDSLCMEFKARFAESKEELPDERFPKERFPKFIWGYWRARMREECVPDDTEDKVDVADTTVRYQAKCKCFPLYGSPSWG